MLVQQIETPEIVRARLSAHDEKTAPLLPYYRERGVLNTVDGMATAEGIATQIKNLLDAAPDPDLEVESNPPV